MEIDKEKERDKVFRRLTTPTRKRSERIIILNKKKPEFNIKISICGTFLIILSLYIILNLKVYFNTLLPLNALGFIEPIRELTLGDKFFLITLICLGIYFYFLSKENKRIINEFENIRAKLINDMGSSFCLCDIECKCKEHFNGREIKEVYLEIMEKEGIDLIM